MIPRSVPANPSWPQTRFRISDLAGEFAGPRESSCWRVGVGTPRGQDRPGHEICGVQWLGQEVPLDEVDAHRRYQIEVG